jgi:hypothetical protein
MTDDFVQPLDRCILVVYYRIIATYRGGDDNRVYLALKKHAKIAVGESVSGRASPLCLQNVPSLRRVAKRSTIKDFVA